ncbi:hypothetical protein L208DRAFT_1385873 [Tricholoma matsutake]|nr:hypothetical protein L208DRAFT_1385873 [Tricholoma matsutake 945]
MMIIDNSEYMRNGDYQPTRFEAQSDAVNTVFQTKIDSNPENTVGIMTMAGKSPEVLVTHTKDLGQILQALHTTSSKIGGQIDIPTSIAIAQLALKHRENKNLRQRIIVFVASPLDGQAADEKAMVKLAKKLKKNNVSVDVVCYGDGIEETNEDGKTVLRAFVENANSDDNSHILSVPPGAHLLSDALISSPILSADRSSSIPDELTGDSDGAMPTGSGANNFEFGVDPSLDPELAMALRISMQEAQAREAAEAASSSTVPPATSTPAQTSTELSTATRAAEAPDNEEERLLQRALTMSEGRDVEMEGADVDEDEDEDAAIARAIEMSMRGDPEEEEERKK